MIITTIMTTPEAARLRLAQYLSPAFPVGGFAWSQGLEYAMDQGLVTRASLAVWLGDWLDHGAGWNDAVLLAMALRDGADFAALDDLARAACLTSQRLIETLEQGTAFSGNVAALGGSAQGEVALPVAIGSACVSMPLPASEIIAAFLQAQTAALISAAVRFMPLGPLEGQAMLAAMQPELLRAANRATTATADDLASATWGADLAAMCHETMDVRIFRS